MSTNYGRSTTSGNNNWQENQGSQNQQGMLVSSIPKGLIVAINLYVAGGLGGTCRTNACLWNSSGTLLVATGNITVAAGGGGINAQAWHRYVMSGAGFAIATGNYYIGFYRNSADAIEWSWINSGGTLRPTVNSGVANVGSPGSLNISSSTTGQLSAYVEWIPSGIYGNHVGGVAPVPIQEVYGSHLAGAPVAVPGVYRGPSGGGTPIQIW